VVGLQPLLSRLGEGGHVVVVSVCVVDVPVGVVRHVVRLLTVVELAVVVVV
jgi:hypothetical protein